MVAKAIVVRKSLGPQSPCGFDSRPGHEIDSFDAVYFFCALSSRAVDANLVTDYLTFKGKDPFRHLFRMVNQKLAVIHSLENFNLRLRIEFL